MKPTLLLFFLVLSLPFLQAQTVPYNVVFDLTSKDTNEHKTVIRWMDAISKERPDAQLEVVLYGQSLDMIQKDKSVVAPALAKLVQNKNIAVKVCAAAMKRQQVDASQLLPGVAIVPDGITRSLRSRRRCGAISRQPISFNVDGRRAWPFYGCPQKFLLILLGKRLICGYLCGP